MCIRHTDYVNDDEKVRCLLNNTLHAIKRIIKAFQVENNPKQNEQCLRNLDVSEYTQELRDVAVWIYQAIIKLMEERVQPLIVPAILQRGMSGAHGIWIRKSRIDREGESPVDPQMALDILLREMGVFFKVMSIHGVDPEIICQVYKQLFYFICAEALNNLLLRKDMCHWSKGMQIRHSLSHLEQWFRDQDMQDNGVIDTLSPIVQASQLLQACKTDENIQSVCDMCDKLTTSQILKILNQFTPAEAYDLVPESFIRKIQACLQKRDEEQLNASPSMGPSALLMSQSYVLPITLPFNPSNIQLEDIVIPEVLDLHHVLRKVSPSV